DRQHLAGRELEIGVRSFGAADAQPPDARMPDRREPKGGREPGVGDGLRRWNVDCPDPQSRQSLSACLDRDAVHDGAKKSLAPICRMRGAVPDVGLAVPRGDLDLDFDDPLGFCGYSTECDYFVVRTVDQTAYAPYHSLVRDFAV